MKRSMFSASWPLFNVLLGARFLQKYAAVLRWPFCTLVFRPSSSPFADPPVSDIISRITRCSSAPECRAIHARVIKSVNYQDGFIGDQLVSCYLKFGCTEHHAWKLFDEIPNRDIISWNSLISSFSRNRNLHECLCTLHRMRINIDLKPNEVTLISIISACATTRALDEGKFVHGLATKSGLLFEPKVVNSLINMYRRCKKLDDVRQLFEAMPEPSLVTWNSMIVACIENGSAGEGIGCFSAMRRRGFRADDATFMALLQACECFGSLRLSETVHGIVVRFGFLEITSVMTALLDLYAKIGRLDAAQEVFNEIRAPDRVAWTAMLAGIVCALLFPICRYDTVMRPWFCRLCCSWQGDRSNHSIRWYARGRF